MKRLLFILTIISIDQSIYGQKEILCFNLIPGQTYYHSMQSSSIIKQDVSGQIFDIDLTISGKIAFKVVDLKDTIYHMDVSFQQLAMTMKLPNGDMSFNSEKYGENDVFSNILGVLTTKVFTIKMTKIGKIVEVNNLDSIFNNVIEQSPNVTPAQKQQIKAQLLQAYGEKSFKGSFEMVTAIYSNLPVEIGSTWTINTKLESGMAASLITSYEFKDKKENYNLILGIGKLETLDKDSYTQINEMPAKYDLTGTMNSRLKVDNKTGWIIEAIISQSITGNAEIKDNPKLPGGLKIPMTFETEMKYSSN